MQTIDELAENGSADHAWGQAPRPTHPTESAHPSDPTHSTHPTHPTPPARVAVVANGARSDELIRRGVPGFEIERIDGAELMARRSLGHPVITNFAGTTPEQVALYRLSNIVLSPSRDADRALLATGVRARRICRWSFAVDCGEFSPAHFTRDAFPGAGDPSRINLLYTGPLETSSELDSLLEAFRTAQLHDPRIELVPGEPSPSVYASADLLLVPGASDLYGQAIVEAQASGLPVLAVQEGAAVELIESGRSGCLVPAGTFAFAEAIRWLARRATLRERLATGGLLAAREHTWDRSLKELSEAWQAALRHDHGPAVRAA